MFYLQVYCEENKFVSIICFASWSFNFSKDSVVCVMKWSVLYFSIFKKKKMSCTFWINVFFTLSVVHSFCLDYVIIYSCIFDKIEKYIWILKIFPLYHKYRWTSMHWYFRMIGIVCIGFFFGTMHIIYCPCVRIWLTQRK